MISLNNFVGFHEYGIQNDVNLRNKRFEVLQAEIVTNCVDCEFSRQKQSNCFFSDCLN